MRYFKTCRTHVDLKNEKLLYESNHRHRCNRNPARHEVCCWRSEVMRSVIDCGMPVDNAVEMMLSSDMNERKNWDSMMDVEIIENYGPNDDLIKYSVKVPFMAPMVQI